LNIKPNTLDVISKITHYEIFHYEIFRSRIYFIINILWLFAIKIVSKSVFEPQSRFNLIQSYSISFQSLQSYSILVPASPVSTGSTPRSLSISTSSIPLCSTRKSKSYNFFVALFLFVKRCKGMVL
jgi:hypothetical protein